MENKIREILTAFAEAFWPLLEPIILCKENNITQLPRIHYIDLPSYRYSICLRVNYA